MNQDKRLESYSLEKLQAGDRAEFARVLEDHSAAIYRLALKILNNSQDAEDILQETFIKAFRSIGSFDGRAKLSTWLYRIATNEALMLLRKRRVSLLSIEDPGENSASEQEPLEIMDWCCLPEEELMSSEALAHLDEAIDALPHSLRVVFLLRDIEGQSTREVAEILNLTETAVKTRLSRARLRLRELLSVYYAELLERQRNGKE
jgi:RNA polymerase sigma-70 factor, ECF subfamily